MRLLGGLLLLFALVLGTMVGPRHSSAQDATPAATGDCAVLPEDEVIQLAEDYLAAVEAGDAELIEAILHDDVSHNLDDVSGNQPGNEDEIAVYQTLGEIDFTINEIFVDGETVVMLYSFSFFDGEVTGTAIAIVEMECGQVIEIHQESTVLGTLIGVAMGAPEATPAP